jgi:copper resistance protein B
MRRSLLIAACGLALPATVLAQHAEHGGMSGSDQHGGDAVTVQADPHGGHDMPPGGAPPSAAPEGTVPPEALSGPEHAADTVFDPDAMRDARERLLADQGGMRSYKVMLDQLETRFYKGDAGYRWDGQAWYGGDIDKLWIESEGQGLFDAKPEEIEVQVLWDRAITPWFDLQAGARYDFEPDPTRGFLVLGLQGLAPYLFELDADAFLSEDSDVSARIEVEYDLLITQRLVLQPRAEVNLAVQDVPEYAIGNGFNDVTLDLRLRYEVAREFAPYVGVSYERKLGETSSRAQADGEDVESAAFLVGVRVWF